MFDREPVLDRAGGPMVWSKAIEKYVHWLPVCKIQFETFLCDQPAIKFDQAWYDEVLAVHGGDEPHRVSPALVQKDNYHRAILTGVKPSEIAPFVTWQDDAEDGFYAVPTHDEWYRAYAEFAQKKPIDPDVAFTGLPLTSRMKTLLKRMDAVAKAVVGAPGEFAHTAEPTLADQMLMKGGVIEWVQWAGGKQPFGGRGRPANPKLIGSIQDFTIQANVLDPGSGYEKVRLAGIGFRLLRRDA